MGKVDWKSLNQLGFGKGLTDIGGNPIKEVNFVALLPMEIAILAVGKNQPEYVDSGCLGKMRSKMLRKISNYSQTKKLKQENLFVRR